MNIALIEEELNVFFTTAGCQASFDSLCSFLGLCLRQLLADGDHRPFYSTVFLCSLDSCAYVTRWFCWVSIRSKETNHPSAWSFQQFQFLMVWYSISGNHEPLAGWDKLKSFLAGSEKQLDERNGKNIRHKKTSIQVVCQIFGSRLSICGHVMQSNDKH